MLSQLKTALCIQSLRPFWDNLIEVFQDEEESLTSTEPTPSDVVNANTATEINEVISANYQTPTSGSDGIWENSNTYIQQEKARTIQNSLRYVTDDSSFESYAPPSTEVSFVSFEGTPSPETSSDLLYDRIQWSYLCEDEECSECFRTVKPNFEDESSAFTDATETEEVNEEETEEEEVSKEPSTEELRQMRREYIWAEMRSHGEYRLDHNRYRPMNAFGDGHRRR